MIARIYQPAKTAMQSGQAKTQHWVLEYEPAQPREADPLMGWTSSGDMRQQIALRFATKDEAIAYAQRNGIPYRIFEAHPRGRTKKAYADNFKFGRIGSWTH
ncbi:MAG: ETC complex I subunit [Rhodomicrobium sp.]|nr:ETC complex I subunit [Rhodomicrobium sp.]